MPKIIYIFIVIIYAGIIGLWLYRFPISNRIVGGNYDLIQNRDLTIAEREAIEKSFQIRRTFSNILLYGSVLLSIRSYIILRNAWIGPNILVKCVMITSGSIAVAMIIINGIHFIPGPPIR